jgi:hypothetical protein
MADRFDMSKGKPSQANQGKLGRGQFTQGTFDNGQNKMSKPISLTASRSNYQQRDMNGNT